jgi:hypothetical protein
MSGGYGSVDLARCGWCLESECHDDQTEREILRNEQALTRSCDAPSMARVFHFLTRGVDMDPFTKQSKDMSSRQSNRTLPSFGFVGTGMTKVVSSSHSAPMDCEGQCLSGCKEQCITVSN